MSFDSLLVHTLTAFRRPGTVDSYGLADEATVGGTAVTSTVCRVTTPQGGKVNSERNDEVFENLYLVFIRSNVDVREDDLVHVVDFGGNVIIQSGRVQQRNEYAAGRDDYHHSTLQVWEQAGPQTGVEA